jgi:hypothetical protein
MHKNKENYSLEGGGLQSDAANCDVNLIINNFHFPSYILPPPHIFIRFELQSCYRCRKRNEKENVCAVWVHVSANGCIVIRTAVCTGK